VPLTITVSNLCYCEYGTDVPEMLLQIRISNIVNNNKIIVKDKKSLDLRKRKFPSVFGSTRFYCRLQFPLLECPKFFPLNSQQDI
jgi:hypothetical protein